ncbi:hypothetical protein ACH4F6_15490 [Streptomyces sp. NPDC017936]|uniref:hypothetical protein n=1 Tax=Streptomyces sp. NPDC017936 TaxID=3365016 RepID=UPI0037A835BF
MTASSNRCTCRSAGPHPGAVRGCSPVPDAGPRLLVVAVEQAEQAVHDVAGSGSSSEDTGTTPTAMLRTGSQPTLVHTGDSRVHLLRDG